MNTESVAQFDVALARGDDASALSLLENGRVTTDSVWVDELDGVRLSRPIIFLAVEFVREPVARALVRLGASIDSFRVVDGGVSGTPAADAMFDDAFPALSLCLKLGANMSSFYRIAPLSPAGSPTKLYSGQFALVKAKCWREMLALLGSAVCGSRAKACYEVLESRGFNFKALEGLKCAPSDKDPSTRSVADCLLSYAQHSGAVDLIRYLMKDLGLVNSAGQMESLKDVVAEDCAKLRGDGVSPPKVDLTKYKCAACDFVGATEFCSRCEVPRYCSKECQRSHWKTGGHKQECNTMQTPMRSIEGAKEGSSSAAGSS